ncbi:hypothetical protein BGZ94_002931, partial [Podila epigama]
IRMILTKLGNEVDIRQGKLAAIEEKNKPSASQDSIFGKFASMFESTGPKIASTKELEALTSEVANFRQAMEDVGKVFDLYEDVVRSFEKKQQSSREGGSALNPEQIEALIAPVEEEIDQGPTALFASSRQRRYVPQGLVKKSLDNIPIRGSPEDIIMSYENETLVKWTLQAEKYLQRQLHFKVPLRWLAAYPNLAFLGVLILSIVTLSLLSSFLAFLGGSGHQQHIREPHISKTAQTQNHNLAGHYDAHVQPVYTWERPDQSSPTSQGRRAQPPPRGSNTRPAQPQYTIDLEGI